jgi:hypothetical protein
LKELLLKLLVKFLGLLAPRVGLFQVPQKALPMLKILEVRFEDAARDDRHRAQGPWINRLNRPLASRNITFLAVLVYAPFCKLFVNFSLLMGVMQGHVLGL